jgi:hypothetical protein
MEEVIISRDDGVRTERELEAEEREIRRLEEENPKPGSDKAKLLRDKQKRVKDFKEHPPMPRPKAIQTEQEYQEALEEISPLMAADPTEGTPEAAQLEQFARRIEAYEEKMVRLEQAHRDQLKNEAE